MEFISLYEQLKPKYRIELEKNLVKYQFTFGCVKSDLMSCEFTHDIKYNTFSELNSMNVLKLPPVTSFFDMIDY